MADMNSHVAHIEFDENDLDTKRMHVPSPPRLETRLVVETGKEENNNHKHHPGSSSRSDSVSPDMKRKRFTDSPLADDDEVRVSRHFGIR